MPDVQKIRNDLQIYVAGGYSLTWTITKVVTDYRLWNFTGMGNAWIDDIVRVYTNMLPVGTKVQYI